MAKWTKLTSSDSSSGDMSTLLAKDAEVSGTMKTQGSLRIDGRVKGDLICSKLVSVGSSGFVEGNIQADSVVVAGRVKGSLSAKQKIHLEATADVEGDLSAARLSIEEGAKIRGHATTEEARVPAARPAIKLGNDSDPVDNVPRNRPMSLS